MICENLASNWQESNQREIEAKSIQDDRHFGMANNFGNCYWPPIAGIGPKIEVNGQLKKGDKILKDSLEFPLPIQICSPSCAWPMARCHSSPSSNSLF